MGDETTEDEGFNMQQIPKHQQDSFLAMTAIMGNAYKLHTPWAISTALKRGLNTVKHPYQAGPFFLLMPMNIQPQVLAKFNLRELPANEPSKLGPAFEGYQQAVGWIRDSAQILVKVGGGGIGASEEIVYLLELSNGVCVHTPVATGVVPYHHPRCLGVGGSKGSLCGNFAMDEADLLIAIGTRAVCQSDSSRTGYPNVKHVININASLEDATHYQDTLALVGDAQATIQQLNRLLSESLGDKNAGYSE